MRVLVVPSIRSNYFMEFMNAWDQGKQWDMVILVEDNPTKTFDSKLEHHYSWEEITHDLKDKSWIISRRDSAIRSYGFLVAHRKSADYIFTLDDDCFPDIEDSINTFANDHVNRLENSPKWIESIPNMRTRGLPYINTGKLGNVVMNMGLWRGVPDIDAVAALSTSTDNHFYPPSYIDRIIPSGQYTPICGMNLVFRKNIAVLAYFPLMGEGYPYRRFDDIWFGIIAKKICDHLGLLVSVGNPIIYHRKASNPLTNLVKEAPGIAANEHFWKEVDKIIFSGSTPKECMIEMGICLESNQNEYISKLGMAIRIWCELF